MSTSCKIHNNKQIHINVFTYQGLRLAVTQSQMQVTFVLGDI